MRRTTVMLPEKLKVKAKRRASQEGVSLGELIRRSLAQTLLQEPAAVSDDPLFADDAVFRGEAPADLAAEHDRHLYG
ncbi:MAG: CopG family transcriptional regulator [Thermoanaerobaculia bacterium]